MATALLVPPGEARLVVLVAALCLAAAIGDAPFRALDVPRPGSLVIGAIALFDRRLNRENRRPTTRRIRGAIVAGFMLSTALALGVALAWLAARFPTRGLVDLAVVTGTLSLRGPFVAARRVAALLETASPSDATYGTASEGVALLAATLTDGVVAPTFYYGLGGLPALLVWSMARLLGQSLATPPERHLAFGWAARRIDNGLGAVPARLAGLLLAAAAPFVPNGQLGRALITLGRASHFYPSAKRGWPLAAIAGALDLALASGNQAAPWIGDGRARITAADLRRAAMLFAVAALLLLLVLAGLATLGARG